MSNNSHKEGVTYGNIGMYRALISILKIVNVKVIYAIMSIFVIPVALLVGPGTHITYYYYRRIREFGKWKAFWFTYRNNCIFGQTVIDKFATYAGKKFRFKYNNLDVYNQLQDSPNPLFQLQAHIGCSELLGYSLPVRKTCNVLAYGGEKAELMDYRESIFSQSNIKIIPVGAGSSHSDDILTALEKGETICTFADRLMNVNKYITACIFGHKVKLARNPFSIAVSSGAEVVMASAMKEKDGSYSAFFTMLNYDKSLPKSQQRQQLANAYAAEIERLLQLYPLQWFNYVDYIWDSSEI